MRAESNAVFLCKETESLRLRSTAATHSAASTNAAGAPRGGRRRRRRRRRRGVRGLRLMRSGWSSNLDKVTAMKKCNVCSTSRRVSSELKRGGWEGGGGERGEKVQCVDLFHHIILQLTKVTLSLQAAITMTMVNMCVTSRCFAK